MDTRSVIETTGTVVEVFGVAVMVAGGVIASIAFATGLVRRDDFETTYRLYRRGLGRAILLGLEFLVAADIIRTVAISPTLESVVVLGAIVLIRTALSFSLEVEINGRWPWQRPCPESKAASG